MAVKIPLVLATTGGIEQLQAGDVIAGGASNALNLATHSSVAAAITKGSPCRYSSAGKVQMARADALANARVLGLAQAGVAADTDLFLTTFGLVTMTTAEWDVLTGGAGGLTAGALYFLDPATVGGITLTAPTTVGECVVELGLSLANTEMLLAIKAPILL